MLRKQHYRTLSLQSSVHFTRILPKPVTTVNDADFSQLKGKTKVSVFFYLLNSSVQRLFIDTFSVTSFSIKK